MKVLDLFAGLRGWSDTFRARGHEVRTLDLDPRFDADYPVDILEWDARELPWRPDIILASPPCEGFSVMNIGKNWTRPDEDPPHAPKTERAWTALKIVQATRRVIAELEPAYFIIENPRAKLRKLPVVADLERRTVTYCRYAETTMKPTDLFGGFPPSLVLEQPCDTRGMPIVEIDGVPWVLDRNTGKPCHISAPRGSRTPGSIQGVTGKDADAIRAKVPAALALAVCLATERDLAEGAQPVPLTLFDGTVA